MSALLVALAVAPGRSQPVAGVWVVTMSPMTDTGRDKRMSPE